MLGQLRERVNQGANPFIGIRRTAHAEQAVRFYKMKIDDLSSLEKLLSPEEYSKIQDD